MSRKLHNQNNSLLYFCPLSRGGIADYAREQVNALARTGMAITLLSPPTFKIDSDGNYTYLPLLRENTALIDASRMLRRIRYIINTIQNIAILSRTIRNNKFKHVLFASYFEYASPLWAWQLKKLKVDGVIFAAVIHDPIRDYIVGPRWWHRWSVAVGYSFLDIAFVHEGTCLDTIRPMPELIVQVVPQGPYNFPAEFRHRDVIRSELNIPLGSKVMLVFGHIRDNKNLDLIIEALVDVPKVYLIIAGEVLSERQKPIKYYKKLATKLGVSDRCRWLIKYISEKEIGEYFNTSDVVLLPYSAEFRSASSVLNVAVYYRKPCIVSSGDGNLKEIMKKYKLGIFIEPDNKQKLISAINQWLTGEFIYDVRSYISDISWNKNAELVINRFKLIS